MKIAESCGKIRGKTKNELTKKEKLDIWNNVKYEIHKKRKFPGVDEGTVWWCNIGENVGVEINGKSRQFTRPVMILKKLSRTCFWTVPLSTQPKTGNWYVHFRFRGEMQTAVVGQIRTISIERLGDKLGTVDDTDYKRIKDGVRQVLD